MSDRLANMDPRVREILPAGKPVTSATLRAAHVAVYGLRPPSGTEGSGEWSQRFALDTTRMQRARLLLRRDGTPCAERPDTGRDMYARKDGRPVEHRRRVSVPGRDGVELWGRPFPKEAAAAIVGALDGTWGPDRSTIKTSAIARALIEHGYKFQKREDDGAYDIRPPTAEELEYDNAVAVAGETADALVAAGVVPAAEVDRVRKALVARVPRPTSAGAP